MSDAIDRRLFLKALPGAAAVAQLATPQSRAPEPQYPAIGAARYRVRGDYAIDESSLMYAKLVATGESDFGIRGSADNFTYWTSTQQTADMAHHIDFADLGRPHYDARIFHGACVDSRLLKLRMPGQPTISHEDTKDPRSPSTLRT